MAGEYTDNVRLNNTLVRVCDVLQSHSINDWFIMFGTLLGITRDGNCIQGDDDIDIMINHDYDELRDIFEKTGFVFTSKYGIKRPDTIMKTEPNDTYGSVDFYMCVVDDNHYYTPWQNVELRDVSIVRETWKNTTIHKPNNTELRLEKMYGTNWRSPIQYNDKQKLLLGGIYNRSFKTFI